MAATLNRSGICLCGCGRVVGRALKTSERRGHKAGEFKAYIHGHNRRRPICARFWEYVDKSDGCWNWTGTLNDSGYGVLHGPNRRIIRAHRYSYALHANGLDEDALVLHRCDNRRCVNPSHLFLGDHADNMRDKVQKGRHQRGGSTPGALVTDTEAFLIRLSPGDTRSRRLLAAIFQIRRETVCGIQGGRVYASATFGGAA
jgi:hypothetical protein